jgi:hypothetical protein
MVVHRPLLMVAGPGGQRPGGSTTDAEGRKMGTGDWPPAHRVADGAEIGSTGPKGSGRDREWPTLTGKIATANDNSRVSAQLAA